MKLLQVINSLDPRTGGPAEHMRVLEPVLRGMGHETDIACFDGSAAEWLNGWSCKVHTFGPAVTKFGFSRGFLPWLKKEKSNYDAVIVRGLWQYSGYAVWLALKHSKTPYFVFPHGMLDPWFNKMYPLKRLKKLVYWHLGGRDVLRDARAVLFTSEQERRLARNSFSGYKCRERVVSYGTVASPDGAERLKQVFLERFPMLKGKKVFLFLGRIHEKKGCDILISAFAEPMSAGKDAVLVMAGPGEKVLVDRLKDKAGRSGVADRILWTGMLYGEDKWGAFYSADLFVLPSHQENFGIAVAEALSSGTPVLITDKVNIWETIDSSHAGIVVGDDACGVKSGMLRWAEMGAGQREDMRVMAKECFDKNFHIQAAAESLISAVRDNL